jgi:TRAP-type mannitol/chloroaromatic compound transport system permease small subunit
MHMMTKLIHMIDRFAERTGVAVAWLTMVMMLVTCAVVLARYLFDIGSIALQESIVYLHGTVFMSGIAYTLKNGGHVRVDIFYQRFSRRTRAMIDIFGSLFFLFPVAGFIFWSSLEYVSFSWSLRESSPEPGGLPAVYLLKTLIPIMAATLGIQGVGEVLRNISIIVEKE